MKEVVRTRTRQYERELKTLEGRREIGRNPHTLVEKI